MKRRFKVKGHGIKPGKGEYDLYLECTAEDEDDARKQFLELHPTVILEGRLTVEELK